MKRIKALIRKIKIFINIRKDYTRYVEVGKAVELMILNNEGIIIQIEDKHDTGFAFNTLGDRFSSIEEIINWNE